MIALLLALMLMRAPPKFAARPTCLDYEPAIVQLRGALAVETFPSSSFSDVQHGDQREYVWVLTLPTPMCVNPNAADDVYRAVPSVTRVQVGFDEFSKYDRFASLLGHNVVVTGSLFPAHTAHHHTDLLMTIQTIKRIKDS